MNNPRLLKKWGVGRRENAMHIKAIWRLALIIAACFWISQTTSTNALAQGAEAASSAQRPGTPIVLKKYTKRHSRHARRASTRSRKKAAQTKPPANNRADKDTTAAESNKTDTKGTTSTPPAFLAGSTAATPAGERTLSPSIANARAQLEDDTTLTPPPAPDAPEMAAAPTTTVSDAAVSVPNASSGSSNSAAPAAAENDAGRATAAPPPMQSPIHASPSPTPRAAATTTVGQTEASAAAGDTWSRTSLIGKIFVAFGGLLTLASAARLFIA